MDLIPPDYQRCQCEITPAHGPFRLGPRPQPARCKNPPSWLAVELIAGNDGQYGAMCLCTSCAETMLEDADLRARVQLQPILKEST